MPVRLGNIKGEALTDPIWFGGSANNWIKSGSGMRKNPAHFVLDSLLRPLWMLAVDECRLVPPHGPVKLLRRLPALLRRHAPKHFDLFGTGLFIRKHEKMCGEPFNQASAEFFRRMQFCNLNFAAPLR